MYRTISATRSLHCAKRLRPSAESLLRKHHVFVFPANTQFVAALRYDIGDLQKMALDNFFRYVIMES